jgi:hypothetical protein
MITTTFFNFFTHTHTYTQEVSDQGSSPNPAGDLSWEGLFGVPHPWSSHPSSPEDEEAHRFEKKEGEETSSEYLDSLATAAAAARPASPPLLGEMIDPRWEGLVGIPHLWGSRPSSPEVDPPYHPERIEEAPEPAFFSSDCMAILTDTAVDALRERKRVASPCSSPHPSKREKK